MFADVGPPQMILVAAGESKSKLGDAFTIVKSALEMSKKIFPTASTFILAVVVGTFGMVNNSDPSLGVLAISTVGKVCPPSVDRDIFTLAQLTGAAVVLATDQVMVCEEDPIQETFVLG